MVIVSDHLNGYPKKPEADAVPNESYAGQNFTVTPLHI